jgi:hypothetical protein
VRAQIVAEDAGGGAFEDFELPFAISLSHGATPQVFDGRGTAAT